MECELTATFQMIELTEEELRQCSVINTAEGPIHIMPLSVIEKLRRAFWDGMQTLEVKEVEK